MSLRKKQLLFSLRHLVPKCRQLTSVIYTYNTLNLIYIALVGQIEKGGRQKDKNNHTLASPSCDLSCKTSVCNWAILSLSLITLNAPPFPISIEDPVCAVVSIQFSPLGSLYNRNIYKDSIAKDSAYNNIIIIDINH